jgi:3-oxo-4,17-pregnadiene-20-carboxyl-CoA hydratase alpha subunit
MARVIPPSVDADDQYFWDGVREHQLLLQQCASCGTLRHPPVPMCGVCHATQWTTSAAAGTGTVHSWIVSKPPSDPTDPGRIVVLVELTEGLRIVGNLVDVERDDVRNEMAVEVCFREYDGITLPQFRPADGAR